MSPSTILIVDDTPTNLDVLVRCLGTAGYDISVANDGPTSVKQAALITPALILMDVVMPGWDGFETARRLLALPHIRDVPIIFMTSLVETEHKIKAFQSGAVDYITKPIQVDEVLARVRTHIDLYQLRKDLAEHNIRLHQEIQKRQQAQSDLESLNSELENRVAARTAELSARNTALNEAHLQLQDLRDRLQAENTYLRIEARPFNQFNEFETKNRGFQDVLSQLDKVAKTSTTVLIRGETGTGKEMVAQALHNRSARHKSAMVTVNCAAMPAELIESELFGHERGAFTGAVSRKLGRFEVADGGTLFLDEIGDLPANLQASLLRVLQEGEFNRVGNPKPIKCDVRVVAATHVDLELAVREGRFREDLFYRLNVFPITLPPLRDRLEDIPNLVFDLLNKHGRKMGRSIEKVDAKVIDALSAYDWPGNIRELENLLERALILNDGPVLSPGSWLPEKKSAATITSQTLEYVERRHILETLELTGGRVSGPRGAARILGLNPSTLESRLRKLAIKPNKKS